ncbi:alpha/beta fold hydrolase [Aeromicrobium sp. CTD01-1L150]|uniref:alpha/beta fold hydrolase n=1 Tax=Aeromicrobium sp. CTD01-1L150 TaxID=3341830 RepID=UPI0035BFE631
MSSAPCPPRIWSLPGGVRVSSRGSGPPTLLLHGIGGGARTFSSLAELIAQDGYAVHAWDAPGYGGSSDPLHKDIDHVAAVVEVVETLDAGPVHILGTSWGATLAIRVAFLRPDLVTSLVLVDGTRGSAVTALRRRRMLERIPELAELGGAEFARRRSSRLVSPRSSAATLDAVRATMAEVRLSGYAAAAHMMAATDVSDDLAHLAAATLVLVGEDDIVTGVDESRLIADGIPGAEFGIIRQAGHSAVVEQPAAVWARTRQFWQQQLAG